MCGDRRLDATDRNVLLDDSIVRPDPRLVSFGQHVVPRGDHFYKPFLVGPVPMGTERPTFGGRSEQDPVVGMNVSRVAFVDVVSSAVTTVILGEHVGVTGSTFFPFAPEVGSHDVGHAVVIDTVAFSDNDVCAVIGRRDGRWDARHGRRFISSRAERR